VNKANLDWLTHKASLIKAADIDCSSEIIPVVKSVCGYIDCNYTAVRSNRARSFKDPSRIQYPSPLREEFPLCTLRITAPVYALIHRKSRFLILDFVHVQHLVECNARAHARVEREEERERERERERESVCV